MKYGPFEVYVNPHGITVGKDTKGLPIAPGEVNSVCSMVGLVMKMKSLKVFPPRVTISPFKICFSEEEDGRILCTLKKKKTPGELNFYFDEGDELLKALHGGIKQHTDHITVGSGKRRVIPGRSVPEPPMDGRL